MSPPGLEMPWINNFLHSDDPYWFDLETNLLPSLPHNRLENLFPMVNMAARYRVEVSPFWADDKKKLATIVYDECSDG
uniref:Uncharacterized protein n=1 Tax=uncultured crenarchaeote TaxID=29281 RepID=H5SBA3_9CREN|nr:hypothetical protein HGMM_F06G04C48 [uncultured crenarchaeote]